MERPKLLIVAGPNGSGKTTVTSKILKHEWVENCEYINPDFIARDKFGDWNSHEAVLQAAQYATQRREKCLIAGKSLIFETVLSAPDKVDFVKRAIESGFFIRLFFIGTDNPQINAARIAQRVMKGGHDVPIPKIISRYYKSIINCAILAPIVDRLYVYDNSKDNVLAELLFRASDGNLTKQYAQNHIWTKIIFENLTK
ncbi:MAG: zeta toxin family protein [Bacteroidales bacterium]|jgi:predicted ABC-type ATPase|nr:zeta toxin family protein [Bacteroidales bacterium]